MSKTLAELKDRNQSALEAGLTHRSSGFLGEAINFLLQAGVDETLVETWMKDTTADLQLLWSDLEPLAMGVLEHEKYLLFIETSARQHLWEALDGWIQGEVAIWEPAIREGKVSLETVVDLLHASFEIIDGFPPDLYEKIAAAFDPQLNPEKSE
jgi:hypothetical protein